MVNRSQDVVTCRIEPTFRGAGFECYTVPPDDTTTLELPSFRVGLILTPQSLAEKETLLDEKEAAAPDDFAIRVPLSLTALWKAVPVSEDCPWLVYRVKVRNNAPSSASYSSHAHTRSLRSTISCSYFPAETCARS